MAVCKFCGMDINPKAMNIHERLCPKRPKDTTIPVAKLDTPVSVIPSTTPAPMPQTPTTVPIPAAVTVQVLTPPLVDIPVKIAEPAIVADISVNKPGVVVPHINGNGAGGSIEVFDPILDPFFILSEQNIEALRVTIELSKDHPTCLLITGSTGCGKTSTALQMGAVFHRPVCVADMGVIMEPQQLFQTTRLIPNPNNPGSVITDTRESGFVKGLETPGCIQVLDEMNRVENERCLNPLMPILDGRAEIWIDELRRRVKVAPGVIIVATINEGALFCGINSVDGALRDRFREINLGYLPADNLSQLLVNKTGVPKTIADSLAQFCFTVYNTPAIEKKVSHRQALTAAKSFAKGTALWMAVEAALGNYNDTAWRQQVMEVFSLNILDEKEHQNWINRDREVKYVSFTR